MADPARERLLASYGDLGEAMVAENVLHAGGVACRVGDLAGLPSHLLGSLGGLNRSVGIWVLEADVARAHSVLATMRPAEADRLDDHAPAGAARSGRGARWIAPAVAAVVLAVVALFAARG